jgi:hypothetical protein
METARHHPIRRIKRLFHTIPMMAVDIDVQHARIAPEELEDGEVDVVDVAESGGFALFCVVQTACPVYGYVCGTGCYSLGRT